MSFVAGFAVLTLAALYLYGLYRSGSTNALMRALRFILGGGVLLFAGLMGLRGQVGPASLLGALGASILLRGRIGPIDFNTTTTASGGASRVKSRFIEMALDHDSGDMSGRVVAGSMRGADLADLGEDESRQLYHDVASDPDSLALFETWFDKYRHGWRDYFGPAAGEGASASGDGLGSLQEAYAVLGLEEGATADEVIKAHRRMMKNVHPDHGGSTYMASKVNAAKDMLLDAIENGD